MVKDIHRNPFLHDWFCQPARNPPSLPMVTDPCRRQDLIIWLWHHPYEFCQKALLGTGSGGVTCRDGGVGCPNESAATVGIMDGFFPLEYWGYEMCHDPSFFTATFCRYISVHIFLRCFEMSKAGHGTFLWCQCSQLPFGRSTLGRWSVAGPISP